ncbi:hypothetical protein DXG01_001410 [Tephrocybe rancida]|nr:hypothetical protein DXG01_001410 [Tephrocybe rancida]
MQRHNDIHESAHKFWSIYAKEAEQHDKVLTETWKSDMDSTLIFAGLFSATVTAFIIESYKKLSEDWGDTTVSLLKQMLAVQLATSSQTGNNLLLPASIPATTFVPTASAVAVNILWFLSLACSLAAALCITLVQQWIRDYLQMVERYSQPQRRAEVRGYLFSGIEKWKMDAVVEFIPTLLHASLLFFFVGLCIFLGPISRAVAGAVVAIVFLCISFYLFATFAPLFDPSAPYQTPLSLALWRLRHPQHTLEIKDNTQPSLTVARETLATRPLTQEDSIQRKSQALVWVYERVSDHQELEDFLGSIRLLLQKNTGAMWSRAFAIKLTFKTVEENIFSLLKTTLSGSDPEEQRRRAIVCLDLLVTIIPQQDPRAGPIIAPDPADLKHSDVTLEQCLQRWEDNSQLCTLVACASVLLDHRELVSGAQRLVSQRKTLLAHRALSKRADKGLQVASELRAILERVLERHISEPCSPADIATLLHVFFDVLKSSSHDVRVWMNVMGDALHDFGDAPLLWQYWGMPRRTFDFRIAYQSLPYFSNDVELCLYPYEILAAMHTENILMAPLSDLSQTWFPLTSKILPLPSARHAAQGPSSKYTYLTRHDLVTIFSLLDIVCATPPTSSIEVYAATPDSKALRILRPDKWMSASRTPFLRSELTTEGPLSTLASIMQDLSHGGQATGLLELVLEIKAQKKKPWKIDTFIISETLNVFCAHFNGLLVSEGSETLFISALFEVLRWERDATTKRPSPIVRDDIDTLLWYLRFNQLSYQSSVALAERLLGDMQSSLEATMASGLNQTGDEPNFEIGSPMGDQSSKLLGPEDYAPRTRLLLDGIDTQRKLWEDKRTESSREAAQSRLPGVE